MPDRLPSCFGGGGATRGTPTSTMAGPNLTTSIYDTHLGVASLTWSRAIVGLTLLADLRLSGGEPGEDDEEGERLRFRVRPWLPWKRRGSRRFSLRDRSCHRCVEFAWDLSRASFHTGGSGRPEPASGFFVAVAFDGEMLLVAGDLVEEAYKKTKARRPIAPFSNPTPTARREHVVLGTSGGPRSYRTMARFGGRNREISIELGPKDREPEAGMAVAVDGEKVVHVQRLRWKFRGTEKVEVESGARMQVSWDLHDWLFQSTADAALSDAAVPTAAERGHAVFVFRFEEEEEEVAKAAEGHSGKVSGGPYGGHSGHGAYKGTVFGGHPGKTRNWSESSSNGGGGAETTAAQRKRKSRRKDLLKTTSSSSSASSASSASSSTVMEWASQEEMELQRSDGFSLLVYIREN
ncbi:unnamed protein product [Musa acuminata subsp. burmannicoides]